ncbi:50S small subunit ribosomal protein L22 [Cryptococcus gattii NT-10]|nr:50S small subunit ribosomal protein L22 [Cryptococcus gattii NT-10]
MAKPLRSLFSIAGTSLPGPSRPLPLRRAALGQVRTAFNLSGFGRYLPNLPTWKSESTEDQPTTVIDEPSSSTPSGETTSDSLFAPTPSDSAEAQPKISKKMKKRGLPNNTWTEHRYASAAHKISHRKLRLLSHQIAGLPVDEAIVQMQFSEKRASKWVKSTLALARDHAVDKNLKRDKLVVAESWVTKGRKEARIDIKGRGKFGIKHHPSARIHLVIREGLTPSEKEEKQFKRDLGRVKSAGVVREDTPLRRKVVSGWTW